LAKFVVWDEVLEGGTLIFGDTQIPLQRWTSALLAQSIHPFRYSVRRMVEIRIQGWSLKIISVRNIKTPSVENYVAEKTG